MGERRGEPACEAEGTGTLRGRPLFLGAKGVSTAGVLDAAPADYLSVDSEPALCPSASDFVQPLSASERAEGIGINALEDELVV